MSKQKTNKLMTVCYLLCFSLCRIVILFNLSANLTVVRQCFSLTSDSVTLFLELLSNVRIRPSTKILGLKLNFVFVCGNGVWIGSILKVCFSFHFIWYNFTTWYRSRFKIDCGLPMERNLLYRISRKLSLKDADIVDIVCTDPKINHVEVCWQFLWRYRVYLAQYHFIAWLRRVDKSLMLVNQRDLASPLPLPSSPSRP